MVAVSGRRSVRDPNSDSKATLCHFGNVTDVSFNSGGEW